MKLSAPSDVVRHGRQSAVSMVVALAASGGSVVGDEPFVFSGLPIMSPKLQISVDLAGYSDSMLDLRSKFQGREYLSGEWAGAIYYEGGHAPAMTYWFPDRFVFPDFYTYDPETEDPHFSNSGTFMGYGPNTDGLEAYGSYIYNNDFEVRMRYEFRDFGMDQSGRLSLGLVPQSMGGVGDFLPSQRYVFQQTYTFKNISGMTLSNVKFHQLLHSLHGDWIVYDGRDYGGGWPSYRFGITMQGDSYAFDQRDYSTKLVTDTVAMKYSMVPFSYEVGAFGMKSAGDHQFGKPATGVHLSVEANSLNNNDFFDPDETNPNLDAWVAGAVSFNLGTFTNQQEKSLDVLLAVKSTYVDAYPPINLKVHSAGYAAGKYTIDFEETTMNPLVGFILRKSTMLDMPVLQWDQLAVPYQLNVPMANWRRFEFAVDPESEPKAFYSIQPLINLSF